MSLTENPTSEFDDLFVDSEQNAEARRRGVYKIKKEIKGRNGEAEIREFVVIAGVELEVNAEGRGTQFTAEEFADFSLDEKTMELLKIYARAIKLNQPPLVEGPTDIGKSKALEYLAFLTNNHLIYQSFSGQTDVSELIGKYVPNTEDARRTFEKILSAKNRGALQDGSLAILKKAGADGRGLTEEECRELAKLEGLSLDRVEWVWQDGTVPKAMEFDGGKGCWLYFDELGAAEPQILVKLNRIFARGARRIEITENGGKEIMAGENFRLIATTNPPSYAGREPFEKDFLRRWVYQRVGNLSQEEFLKRLDFTGHGGKKKESADAPVNLDQQAELDHLLNEVIAMFRYQAETYLKQLPRDSGEQEFRLGDFTDALRVQEYLRQLQGEDLLETLKEAIEFYYLGKIDEDKKDSDNKNVKEKMREILYTIITQKDAAKKITEELEKLKNPEILKQQHLFSARFREFEGRVSAVNVKIGEGKKKKGKNNADGAIIDTLVAKTPEGREIEFNVKEQLKYWGEFYKKTGVDWVKMPGEIRLESEQIEKMKEMMARGYDKMIIIPKNLVEKPTITKNASGKATGITNPRYEQLHRLMRQKYNETYQGDGYKNDGSFQGSEDKETGARIILTKDVQNLKDDAEYKATLGKSMEELEKAELKIFDGLSESEYLIYQREYYERTGKHLDEVGWTWLPGSSRPLSGRVSGAGWYPDRSRLDVCSDTRGFHDGDLGCRLAGSFSI